MDKLVGGQEKEEFVKFILILKILIMRNYQIKILLRKVIIQKCANLNKLIILKSVVSLIHERKLFRKIA